MQKGSIRARGKNKRIYLEFTYLSQRKNEPSPYHCDGTGNAKCRCKEHVKARALMGEIQLKIDDGTFEYRNYFPNSKALQGLGAVNASPTVLFATYAQQWLDYLEPVIEYSTMYNYRSAVNSNLLPFFSKLPLKDIKAGHIKAFINSRSNLSPKTIRNYVGVLSTILESAIDDEIIEKNPVKRVKKPKHIKERPNPFTPEEVKEILLWIDNRYPRLTCYFALAFFTGMRPGEVIGLK